MKKAADRRRVFERATTRNLLPLVAIGSGLAAAPAAALELGGLTVQSNLGQPLRASIAYALAPNEMLSDACVSVSVGRSTGGLPGIGRNSLRITKSAILITGETVIREPVLGARVTIDCPYTPNLSREYMLFVDPANVSADTTKSTAQFSAPAARPTPAPAAEPVAAARAEKLPIGQSGRYRVQAGDSLSGIVQRIENRSVELWPAVNAIFTANPHAFIGNDPNKLKSGSWLTIPSLDGSIPVMAAAAPAPVEETTLADAAGPVELASGSEQFSAYEPAMIEEPVEIEGPAATVAEETVAEPDTANLRPGDVILEGENASVEPVATIVIPDTEPAGPETASSTPDVPITIIRTEPRKESSSLVTWLVAGGLAIILALVLFGRRIRSRFGSTPVGPVASQPARRATDNAETVDVTTQHDFDIADDSPTEENLALDADLVTGLGLADGTDMDVAQDFGFAATTELDIELPFETGQAESGHETDIIPPLRAEMESILESEVLPESDDYDMSVIMDATKMPQPEDVTERDLHAVPVTPHDDSLTPDNYTISKEIDYDVLEQDYEDELTATQALNEEIARAAAELAASLDEESDEDETGNLPLATVTELDITSRLSTDDDDGTTSDTAALTVNMPGDDETCEMQVANDDETTETDIESGTVDTKAV